MKMHNLTRLNTKKARKKLRKLDDTLNERSKAIKSSSTTDAEAIEMIEMTFNDIDKTIKGVEQDTSFIKPEVITTQRIRGFRYATQNDKRIFESSNCKTC